MNSWIKKNRFKMLGLTGVLCLSLGLIGCQNLTGSTEPDEIVIPNVPVIEADISQKREFRGEFVYFADAAILRECGASNSLSVEVNPKMQLAYEIHRSAPEAPLYFVATGQIELRPSMEEGQTRPTLIVDGDNWYFDAKAKCN